MCIYKQRMVNIIDGKSKTVVGKCTCEFFLKLNLQKGCLHTFYYNIGIYIY